MSAAVDIFNLGPSTEALLRRLFADKLMIGVGELADALDLDDKTVRAMTDEGIIRARRRGRLRGYTERDVRTYLAEGPDAECRRQEKPKPTHVSGGRVIKLSEIVAQQSPKR